MNKEQNKGEQRRTKEQKQTTGRNNKKQQQQRGNNRKKVEEEEEEEKNKAWRVVCRVVRGSLLFRRVKKITAVYCAAAALFAVAAAQ